MVILGLFYADFGLDDTVSDTCASWNLNIYQPQTSSFSDFPEILVGRYHYALENAVSDDDKGMGPTLKRVFEAFGKPVTIIEV